MTLDHRFLSTACSIFSLAAVLLSACAGRPAPAVLAPPSATLLPVTPLTVSPAPSPTETPAPAPTATATPVPTATPTPTRTPLPTLTATPTITPTATFAHPYVQVQMRAFCRYGPGTAYLYSHELRQGDVAEIFGRNAESTWLWIRPQNLNRNCWVAASVVKVEGNLKTIKILTSILPHSDFYGPPQNVRAERQGEHVLIAWERVPMTEDDDRGYLIQATVCLNGRLVQINAQTQGTSYELTDERGCKGRSGGKLFTVDKHGYSDPIEIPWP